MSDAGSWSLISIQTNGNYCESTEVKLKYIAPEDKNVKVSAGSRLSWDSMVDGASYCSIKKPDGTPYYEIFAGYCKVDIDTAYYGDAGAWTVSLGFDGKMEEVEVTVNVEIEELSLESGLVVDTSNNGAINLFCNLKSSFYSVTACRFIRPGDKAGYRMTEGVGNNKYVYFGDGIKNNECGITIFKPEDVDYGSWQCMLIITSSHDEKLMTSFITVEKENSTSPKGLKNVAHDIRTITHIFGRNATIFCKVDRNLRSCTLLSPTGELFTGDVSYVHSGKCVSPVIEMKEEHNGEWKCFMTLDTDMQGITETVNVIVTTNFVAPVESAVYAPLGERAVMSCNSLLKETSFSYCWFKDPSGSLINTRDDLLETYSYYGAGTEYGECGIEIKHVGPQHIGLWKCMVALEEEEYEVKAESSISLNVSDFSTGIFPSYLESVEGNVVVLKLLHCMESVNKCDLITPSGNTVDLQPNQHFQVDADVRAEYCGIGLESGDCGVCLHGLSPTGTFEMWHLSANSSDGNSAEGLAFVSVSASTEMKNASKVVEVQLGSNLTLTCGDNISKDYCVFQGPRPEIATGILTSCEILLSPVAKLHLGIWTCTIGLPHTTKEIQEVITVTNLDPQLSAMVQGDATVSGSVSMHCTIPRSLTFCRFKPPYNDSAFVLSPGVITGNYSYVGAGLNHGDCGLYIKSISDFDIGPWQCSVGWQEEGSLHYASVIIGLGNSANETVSDNKKEILAVFGSKLEVSCQANISLAYCWMRHPSGSQIVPEQEDDLLSVGMCKISVESTNYSDSGIWECHMGGTYSAGDEIVISRSVSISGTRLSAEENSLLVSPGVTAYITCLSVPQGSSLSYCRFIRPDGTNIPAIPGVMEEKYIYYGDGLESGICGLQINNLQNEDIGKWTCAAELQDDRSEATDIIQINISETSVASVSIIVVAVAVSLIVGSAGAVWCVKRHYKRSKQPVPPIVFSELRESVSQSDTGSYLSSDSSSQSETPKRMSLTHI
ncbi:uncharacterized protein LOC126353808 isoform X2 [Schistocerca gregaria]|nr:uncharacterized protein LOC126353808 isoform X2 [Schistocerca gregaria]